VNDADVTLLAGLGLLALGVLCLLVFGVATSITERRIKHRALARGRLPGTATFALRHSRRLGVFLLLDHDRDPTPELSATRCAVSTGAWLDGGGLRVNRIASVGEFDAPAGPITVTAVGPPGQPYVVAPAPGDGYWLIGVGFAMVAGLYGGLGLTAFALIARFIL
jgi:hypothetical protein